MQIAAMSARRRSRSAPPICSLRRSRPALKSCVAPVLRRCSLISPIMAAASTGWKPRALSSKPLRDPRLAFIKNEHWTTQLEDALKEVDTDLNNHRGPNQFLRNAAATLERAIAASKRPCNPEEAWTTGKVDCSLLVKDLLFASGVLSYAPPGS